jgi:hypothetical protein
MGLAGPADSPTLFVSAEGADGARGCVYGWSLSPDGVSQTPSLTVRGEAEGGYFGYSLLSAYDHDGDGVDDLVVAAPWDSTHAAYGGRVFVFLDPGVDMSTGDADVTFYAPNDGAQLKVSVAGDYDGDGLEDLAFFRQVEDVWDGAGLIVTGDRTSGEHDVKEDAALEVWGASLLVTDLDYDGNVDVFGIMGGIDRYEQPFPRPQLTPETDAVARLVFDDDDGGYVSRLLGATVGYGGHDRLVAIAPEMPYGSARGQLFLPSARWDGVASLGDTDLIVEGEQAGDAFATSVALLADQDGDHEPELLVGAPATDFAGTGAGSLYLIPSAR